MVYLCFFNHFPHFYVLLEKNSCLFYLPTFTIFPYLLISSLIASIFFPLMLIFIFSSDECLLHLFSIFLTETTHTEICMNVWLHLSRNHIVTFPFFPHYPGIEVITFGYSCIKASFVIDHKGYFWKSDIHECQTTFLYECGCMFVITFVGNINYMDAHYLI